ncbi:hypothetical protein DPEC_G00089300 [Dallia pectoralis]|uniref:Uncharacterized protein n=1 Tax=Dallia pectoralis TaxID=75939 RepID=A0ACC2H0C2_DALPE|nr:hypothetical protein DPEC_G00089300 [Dallia pectoralis]
MSTKRKAEGHSRTMDKLQTMMSGSSKTDSERDSGFSDASNIDSDGLSRSASKRGTQCPGSVSGSQPPQIAVVGGSYSNMSPMIIMNNVLLKPPGDTAPQKPWELSPAVKVVQPPQVVFVQPVVSHCTNSKEASSKRRRPKKYIPILRSYPKIAPHPGDSSSSSGRGTSCSSSGSGRGRSLASGHRERHHIHRGKQQRHQSGSSVSSGSSTPGLTLHSSSLSPSPQRRLSLTPSLSPTDSSACSSPASSPHAVSRSEVTPTPALTLTPSQSHTSDHPKKAQAPPQPSATDNIKSRDDGNQDDDDGDDGIKRKRFCNTYNILSKSGLLDITLRTKDLLRQNRRTQGDLDMLREHTNLFLQALKTGDSDIWIKLQTSLQEEKEKGSGWPNSLKPDGD